MIPREALFSEMETGLVRFQEGDIVMAKVTPCFENGNIAIGSGLSQRIAFGSSELFVFRSSTIDQRYLFYYLQTQGFKQMCAATMTGTAGLKRVSAYFVRNAPIPVPTTSDQQRISSYLDDCCARIDTAIAEAKASIGEYKLLRQSVITQAVTKGLSPNAPMKHSGVEWIGEIPENWEVRKVKHYYNFQTGFTPDTRRQDYYDDMNGIDWVNISDLSEDRIIENTKAKISSKYLKDYFPKIIPNGSLLYSFKLSVGQVAFAGKDIYSNEAIASFLPSNRYNLNFLYYSSFMIIKNANENIYGAKLLNQDLIKNAFIVFPPVLEQQQIADYLDRTCSDINAMITEKQTTISDLESYKKSLIYEVVTGKRRVA